MAANRKDTADEGRAWASEGAGAPPPVVLPGTVTESVAEALPKELPKELVYVVAPGKSLTTARGVLGPGAEIQPKDLAANGTPEALEAAKKQLEAMTKKSESGKGPYVTTKDAPAAKS